jgi:hypothetical protein
MFGFGKRIKEESVNIFKKVDSPITDLLNLLPNLVAPEGD